MPFKKNPKLRGLKILKPEDAWDQYKESNPSYMKVMTPPKIRKLMPANGLYKYEKLPAISTSVISKYPSLGNYTQLFKIIE